MFNLKCSYFFILFLSLGLLFSPSNLEAKKSSKKSKKKKKVTEERQEQNSGAIDVVKFNKLLENPPIVWMEKQIEEDFCEFISQGISQEAIAVTHEQAASHMLAPWGQTAAGLVLRYRLINGRIFRYKGRGSETQYFLAELGRIDALPNVDIIVSEADGTPEFYHPPNFWMASNSEMQAPILAKSTMKQSRFIVKIPDNQTFIHWRKFSKTLLNASERYPWENKFNMAIWRGDTTDIHINNADQLPSQKLAEIYKTRPRYIISELSAKYPDWIDAGFYRLIPYTAILDVASKFKKAEVDAHDHLAYKYLPVLDGWSCTYPGYLWRLISGSVVMKPDSPAVQWFYNALVPYVHFIPLEENLSDLMDKLSWAREHDLECRKIAENALKFVQEGLMPEHIWYYYARVLQKYALLQRFNLEEKLFECENSDDWDEYYY